MKDWKNNNKRNRLLIIALEGKGDVLTLIGRYDETIDSFQKVLKYSKNSHLTLAKTKRKIVYVYQNQGDYEPGKKCRDTFKSDEGLSRVVGGTFSTDNRWQIADRRFKGRLDSLKS
jgi:tetratricopeptide (TPR) repeat protein